MFWRHDEKQMETALARFSETLDLTENSKSKLTDLTDWLAESRQQAGEEWSHEELFESLMSEREIDKEAIVREVHDRLRTLEEFATILGIYTWLWVCTLIVLLGIIFSTSDYVNWNSIWICLRYGKCI